MRRWTIYAAGILLLAMLPGKGEEIGSLRPAGLVYLKSEEKTVTLATDTDDWGTGATVEEALQNLEKSSPGKIFLQTAEYLVVDENAASILGAMQDVLRPGVKVCFTRERIEPKKAWALLSAHEPKLTIQKLGKEKPEWIVIKEGKYELA